MSLCRGALYGNIHKVYILKQILRLDKSDDLMGIVNSHNYTQLGLAVWLEPVLLKIEGG